MIFTIYKITNKITNKVYIGKTSWTAERRFKEHIRKAKYKTTTTYFHRSIRKYGKYNFLLESLCSCLTEDNANNLEIYFIKVFNSFKDGYNMTPGGDGCLKLSSEAELKRRRGIKKSLTGRIRSEKSKRKQSETRKKRNISPKWKGKKLPEQWRKNLSKAHKGKAPNNEKPVGAFKDNKLILKYRNMTEPKKDGYHHQLIRKCIKDGSSQYKGFVWKYL